MKNENENYGKFTMLNFAYGEMLLPNTDLQIHKTVCKFCKERYCQNKQIPE